MTPETKAKTIKNPEWGQTPWENLTREELILECARMWSAIITVYEEMSGEKGKIYIGDTPLSLMRITRIINDVPPSEDTYRAFFRFADALLFDESPEWRICDQCGSLWGNCSGSSYCPGCMATGKGDIPTRPLTLADIRPKKGETS